MNLLVHDVEERKRGGENKNVDGGEQAQEQNDFALAHGGRIVGGFVHFRPRLIPNARSSKKFPLQKPPFAGWRANSGLGKLRAQIFANDLMAAKVQIPDELKKDLPPTKWGKILSATPVVMAVIATMLAGLASSEMTKAQYDRAFAAQLQSKAGDQWSYFQAKKLRSAVARNTLDLLAATSNMKPLEAGALPNADATTIAALVQNEIPAAAPATFDADVQAALDAVARSKPETEVAADLAKVKPAQLTNALAAATQSALAFDDATKTINKTSDKLDETMMAGDKDFPQFFRRAAALHRRAL
jgi:hypothetical protein